MDKIRDIILNVKEPIIIRNYELDWKCFNNKSFGEWCKEYSEEMKSSDNIIEFVSANKKNFNTPQWEKNRIKIPMTIENFYKDATNKNTFFQENWAALNYTSIEDIPKNCRKNINFDVFGFSGINEKDINFWLSSTGANTPCHYDTYGCNIVVQVYGRKMWLLFPPDAKLTPIRVPYEESSVYCSETFYSPNNYQQFENFQNECYKCVLEAGDILIVPRMYWHYVENMETSLSINYWISLESDIEMQIDECIIKLLIEKFIPNSTDDEIKTILNPNQISEVTSEMDTLKILKILTDNIINLKMKSDKKIMTRKVYPYQYLNDEKVLNLIKSSNLDIKYLKKISSEEFLTQMKINSERYEDKISEIFDDENEIFKIKTILINSICNPEIVKNIRKLYLKSQTQIK